MQFPGLPGSILVDTTVTDGHQQGKKLQAYKYPPHISQMMAKPRLALIPFHSNSYPHRLFHPMPCTSSSLSYTCTTIHRFLIPPSVPASLGTCFFLSFSIQSWWNQPKIHSPLQTLTHNSPHSMWLHPTRCCNHEPLQLCECTTPGIRYRCHPYNMVNVFLFVHSSSLIWILMTAGLDTHCCTNSLS